MQTAWLRGSLDALASLAMLGTAATLIWAFFLNPPQVRVRPAVAIPAQPVSLEGAPILGLLQAPVALVEFSDFECPFCARFARTVLPELKSNYIDHGKVLLAYRHLPLPIHQQAFTAARAADCAAQHDLFWPIHDRMFSLSGLNAESIQTAVGLGGLAEEALSLCLANGTPQVDGDLALAKSLGISSTPTFLVGSVEGDGRVKVTTVLEGARPLQQFEEAILAALSGS